MSGATQICPKCDSPLRPCQCEREDAQELPKVWNSTLTRRARLQGRSGLSRSSLGPSRNAKINPVGPKKAEKHLRAYGPEERIEMVKGMECCVPGCRNPAENAHVKNGGMGRKADAKWIAPICARHHRAGFDRSLHDLGSVELFDREWGTDLILEAEMVEEEWQRRVAA